MAKYVTDVVKNARAALQSHYIEFAHLISALETVEGPEKYMDLIQILGTLLKEYVQKANKRIKKQPEPATE